VSHYLLVSRSADFERRLEAMLGSALSAATGEQLALGTDSMLRLHPRPSVAILGPLLSYEETRLLSSDLTVRYPGVGILVVHSGRSELEDWVDDMVIHAVVEPQADDLTFERVLDRLNAMKAETAPEGEVVDGDTHAAGGDPESNDDVPDVVPPLEAVPPVPDAELRHVIAVLAPKGGQGKTTLAVNIAAGLAEVAPNSVVLVDTDLQFGDIGNALDVTAVRTLADLVDSTVNDEMVLKTSLVRHDDGFFVVPAPRTPEGADQVSASALAELLSALNGIFRYVVVDTAPGLGEHTLTVIDHATIGIFVSNMSVPALRAMHSELSVLADAGLLPARRRLVLNFVDKASGITVKDAARIVGADFTTLLPRSSAVLLASNRGVPLIHNDVRDPAAKAIRSIIEDLEPSTSPTHRRTNRRRIS